MGFWERHSKLTETTKADQLAHLTGVEAPVALSAAQLLQVRRARLKAAADSGMVVMSTQQSHSIETVLPELSEPRSALVQAETNQTSEPMPEVFLDYPDEPTVLH